MCRWLEQYPNREKALFLLKGFKFGFPIPEFKGEGCKIVPNLQSVLAFPQVVKEKVRREIEEDRFVGPFMSPPFQNFRISQLGVVPKREPNTYRLIHHLSFPLGASLNDEIDESLCSVSYSTFEDAIAKIRVFGRSALMAKADIKSSFLLLLVHPTAFNLLGFYFF